MLYKFLIIFFLSFAKTFECYKHPFVLKLITENCSLYRFLIINVNCAKYVQFIQCFQDISTFKCNCTKPRSINIAMIDSQL